MALEGTFKDFHIADIVQLIGLQRKTGTLGVESEEDTLSMIFQEGAVVWAQSTRLSWEQRMVQLLVPQGLLTLARLQEALALQRETGKKLKAILAEKGFLPQKEWDRVLSVEVEEAMYRVFRWRTGRYRFVSQPSVEVADGTIGPRGAESLLMEGIRRVDEWPRLRENIPSPAMVFRIGSRAGQLHPKQIEPGEVRMLDLVDGKRTVQELMDASGLGEFEAMRGLAALAEAGAIVPIGPVPAPAPAEGPPTRAATPLPVRSSLALPSWPPRVAWGLLAAWLVANLVLFRAEPLGIFPLSAARGASLDRVRSLRARADLAELSRDLERYAATTGDVPTSPEALGPFGRGRHLRDPWGHPYQLRPAAPAVGGGISLISAGPDGRIGTSDDIVHGDG
ncbi:MAG: DUF4388 domain-containing protein [candidate division NC10 bacterium]|nr:DUF4388 domain-containing protein [candidate division NC10 bacterium]MBI2114861.1 DUF4388 domain-containing protein [candidate division NC10 bacterium]